MKGCLFIIRPVKKIHQEISPGAHWSKHPATRVTQGRLDVAIKDLEIKLAEGDPDSRAGIPFPASLPPSLLPAQCLLQLLEAKAAM